MREYEHKPASQTSFVTPSINLQTRPFAPPQTQNADSPKSQESTDAADERQQLDKLNHQKDLYIKGDYLASDNNRGSTESVMQRKHQEMVQRYKENQAKTIQAKLANGAAGDKYVQEADRVADGVAQKINATEGVQRQEEAVQTKPLESVQRVESLKEEDELQMKPMLQQRETISGGESSEGLESTIKQTKGGGQPLDKHLQLKMGHAMGMDFSVVRVHTDARSDLLSRAIQAKAFTTGQDVFSRQGAYDPSSQNGQEPSDRELTHVVQQNGNNIQRKPKNGNNATTNDRASFLSMVNELAGDSDNAEDKDNGGAKFDSFLSMVNELAGESDNAEDKAAGDAKFDSFLSMVNELAGESDNAGDKTDENEKSVEEDKPHSPGERDTPTPQEEGKDENEEEGKEDTPQEEEEDEEEGVEEDKAHSPGERDTPTPQEEGKDEDEEEGKEDTPQEEEEDEEEGEEEGKTHSPGERDTPTPQEEGKDEDEEEGKEDTPQEEDEEEEEEDKAHSPGDRDTPTPQKDEDEEEDEEEDELIEVGKEIYFDNKDIDAHYKNERTELREDLEEEITKQAKNIQDFTEILKSLRDLATSDDALEEIKTVFNRNDTLQAMIPKLNTKWGVLEDKTKRQIIIDAVDRGLKSFIEKSKLEEMPIDEQGNVNEAEVKSRRVRYDETKEEQDKTKVTVSSTLNRSPQHDTPNAPVDTTNSVTHQKGKGWEIFVMSPTGDLHMASHKIGKYHHSSLLAGTATAAAGSIKASGGKIEEMNDKSGHYKPGPAQMKQVLHRLQKGGVNLDFKLDLGSIQTTFNKASEIFGGESGLQTYESELGEKNRSEAKTRLAGVRDVLRKFIDVKGEASVKEVFTSIGWKYEISQFGIVIRDANGVLATEQEVLEKLNQKFDSKLEQKEEGKSDTPSDRDTPTPQKEEEDEDEGKEDTPHSPGDRDTPTPQKEEDEEEDEDEGKEDTPHSPGERDTPTPQGEEKDEDEEEGKEDTPQEEEEKDKAHSPGERDTPTPQEDEEEEKEEEAHSPGERDTPTPQGDEEEEEDEEEEKDKAHSPGERDTPTPQEEDEEDEKEAHSPGDRDTPTPQEEDEEDEDEDELIEVGKEIYFDNKDIDAEYKNERTDKRANLSEEIQKLAKDIRDFTEILKALGDLATSDDALEEVKKVFNRNEKIQDILKKVNDWNVLKIATKREIVIAALDRYLKSFIEQSKLEEMPIDEQGNVNEAEADSRRVRYDETKEEQDKTKVTVSSTLNRSPQHDTPNAPVDTTNSVTHQKGKGWEIFVMSPTGDLHMASHKIGKYHHSSLLAGAATAAAGSIKASGGKIDELNDKSGHYKPDPVQIKQVLHRLQKGGVNLDFKLELGSVGKNYNKAIELFGKKNDLKTYGSELSEAKTRVAGVRDVLKKFIDIKGEASVKEVFTSIGWKYEIGQFGIVIRDANGVLATEQEVLEKLNQKFDSNSEQKDESKSDTL